LGEAVDPPFLIDRRCQIPKTPEFGFDPFSIFHLPYDKASGSDLVPGHHLGDRGFVFIGQRHEEAGLADQLQLAQFAFYVMRKCIVIRKTS
jgi:hypothetical protein